MSMGPKLAAGAGKILAVVVAGFLAGAAAIWFVVLWIVRVVRLYVG